MGMFAALYHVRQCCSYTSQLDADFEHMGVLRINSSVVRLEHGISNDILEVFGFPVPFGQALTWFEKQLELLQDLMTYLDPGY
jgi:hypothetical protein